MPGSVFSFFQSLKHRAAGESPVISHQNKESLVNSHQTAPCEFTSEQGKPCEFTADRESHVNSHQNKESLVNSHQDLANISSVYTAIQRVISEETL